MRAERSSERAHEHASDHGQSEIGHSRGHQAEPFPRAPTVRQPQPLCDDRVETEVDLSHHGNKGENADPQAVRLDSEPVKHRRDDSDPHDPATRTLE